MTITEELSEIIVGTRYEEVPEEAFEVARQVCLDGIAVMIAGAREPLGLGKITADYIRQMGGNPDSSLIAAGFKSSAPNAAYANGTIAHALDFDNTWPPLNHPTSPTLPALLAIAERDGLPGRDLLLAVVLAFEVQGRMRLASEGAPTGASFHKPGVSGLMGAVTGAGKLLGLDARQFRMAYGLGGSRAGSSSSNTGTMTKSSHSGHAARMGVECATLAQMGWTAHEDIFGAGLFFEMFYGEENIELELFLKDFANPYRMIRPGVGFKKHPSNYFTHRPIDAAVELRAAHDLDPADIESVEVDFPRFEYVNRPNPRTGLDGKFSIQYATAAALLDGKIKIETFSDERRFAPDIESLLPRVKLNIRDDIPRDFSHTYAIVKVATRDGRQLESRCDKPRGLWGVPLTRDERLTKVHDCTGPALPPEEIEEMIGLVERLHELPDIRRIMAIASGAKGLP